ncbi:hypothetical protein B5566_02455 [Mycobacterium sp. MHSD3]|nr:hypothetical protein B5566_02455 [Mycobacterium sp. MHSD3]
MAELIVAKPALAAAIAVLTEELPSNGYPDAFVSHKLPGPEDGYETYPPVFVRLTRTGGPRINKVTDRANLLVECYANDSEVAELFANMCGAVLARPYGHRRFAGASLRGGEFEGATEFPNPLVTTHERWQFTGFLLVSTN